MSGFRLLREPNLDARLDAFDYQREASDELKHLEYGAIFHEQGLGKTKIAIDIFLHWLESDAVDSVIIVVKKSLIQNWVEELAVHTHVRPTIISQNRKSNFYAFNSPARVYITNYEVVKAEKFRFKLFQDARRLGVVLDEAHKIKNPSAALTQSFLELAGGFKRRLILTGTPVANRPFDIWSQIFFLDQGRSLGEEFETFKENLDLPKSEDEQGQEKFSTALAQIFPRIENFCVRETKDGGRLELPKKEIVLRETDWESLQQSIYLKIRDELGAIILENGIPRYDESEGILKRLLRLVQAASNPAVFDESYRSTPGKFDYVLNDLVAINQRDEKAIVWTSFIKNAEWLREALDEFSPAVVHGSLDIQTRNNQISKFKKRSDCRVLVATPGAAKEGLTLTVANHVLFWDRTFSLDDYLQSQDRIHRISQTRRCFVYNYLMKDSVDQWVDTLLEAKRVAAKYGQGDIDAEEFNSSINYDFSSMLRRILNLEE